MSLCTKRINTNIWFLIVFTKAEIKIKKTILTENSAQYPRYVQRSHSKRDQNWWLGPER